MSLAYYSYGHSEAHLNPLIDAQLETLRPLSLSPLIDAQLETLLPLNLGQISLMPETFELGHLGRLPMELLLLILEELPLISLICFRNTNRLAHHIVDTMPTFQIIVEQAPQAIRGVLAVQTKVRVTLPSLLQKLRQRHCDCCGRLAQHLWLPTTLRLCFHCALFGPMPLEKEEIIQRYGLTDEDLISIPSFRFLPATFVGGYKMNTFQVLREHTLYDTQVAAQLSYERTGVLIRPPGLASESYEVLYPVYHSAGRQGPVVFPPHLVPRCCRRNMATIVVPWVSSDGAKMGVFCKMCLYTAEQDSLYTPADFLEHLERCRVRPFDNYAKFKRFLKAVSTPHLRLAVA